MSRLSKWQAVAALLLTAFLSPAHAEIPAAERAVLSVLYSSTNGASWSNNSGWSGSTVCPGTPVRGSTVTQSPWFGVYCGVPWWRACDVAVAPVPTLGQWALILLGFMVAGVAALRRGTRA